ncbi:MAG: hypothetical protein DRP25_05050 [Thermotoga sp.]|nr:MAG: hypothetical protein DRP25_05050 [Thermotoga sp.]
MEGKIIGVAVMFLVLLLGGTGVLTSLCHGKITNDSADNLTKGNTLYVGGSGPGNYSSIQDAIDNATDGDTVFVYDDFSPYCESIIIDKSINLIGENRETTIINGTEGDTITITADNVKISFFTVTGGRNGIYLHLSSNCTITDCTLDTNSGNGIRLNTSCNNFISDCKISNNEDGISFFNSDNNMVTRCETTDNACYGFLLAYSDNNIITYCAVSYNDDSGFFLSVSSGNLISHCTMSHNHHGIRLAHLSCNNIITNCTIVNNNMGIDFYASYDNEIYLNTFMNAGNVYTLYADNIWNSPHRIKYVYNGSVHINYLGNYWSDYTGEDANDDGIGDTPYPVDNNENDSYPLMVPADEIFGMIVDAGGPYSGIVGVPIQFNGSVVGGFPPYTWHWDFGDGNTSTLQNPIHIYSRPGDYTVVLTVTDVRGYAENDTTIAHVTLELLVDANGPYYGIVGVPIQFHGSVDGGYPPYSWYWDFGDGNTGSLQNPVHVYNSSGVYTVRLTVTDFYGNVANDTTNVTIAHTLIADAGGPYGGIVNTPVHFHGSAEGGFPPYSWYWDFGDGNTSTEQNPEHVYRKLGEYTIKLVVTDSHGYTANDTTYINVVEQDNTPPVLTITKPVKNSLYINNKRMMPFIGTVIVGEINISVNASDPLGISKVEFYIGNKLKATDTEAPYEWTWDEKSFFIHVIKVVAYDTAGNYATEKLMVLKIL